MSFKNTILFYKGIILFFFLLSSCFNKDILDEEQFKKLVVKIHECEAYMELRPSSVSDSFMENCKTMALKETNVSIELFEKTMDYYTKRPSELEAIYDSILTKYD